MKQTDFIEDFQKRMKDRLEMGNGEYGDGLYNGHDLINDVEEELLDLANYAYLMYARVQALKNKLHPYVKGNKK